MRYWGKTGMIRYFAAAILAATVCVVAIVGPVQAQSQRFQIASGDLGQALDAYIHQSGRQLIYRVDDVRGVHSPGVQGEMSADKALAALLSGTGFSSRTDSSGAVAIVRDDAAPLSEIVVTATAGGQGIERQKASFSTSTLSSDDIHRLGPLNTAALLQGIPGGTVASTAGRQGNKLCGRGCPTSGAAPYVAFQCAG